VRLEIIGCGRMTKTRHLPALPHLPDAEVVAVADVNPRTGLAMFLTPLLARYSYPGAPCSQLGHRPCRKYGNVPNLLIPR